jgi:integrase
MSTYQKAKWMLQSFVFPELGNRPIGSITPSELLVVLKKIETQGLNETARRTKQRCGQVFRHGIGLGSVERDITVDLRGLLEPPIVTHHASITDPSTVGALLRAIYGYTGKRTTVCALKLAPLLFVRPGELRTAEWAHVDLGNAEWRIPAAIMKMGVQHIVPLSLQALAVLEELKDVTGHGRYLFPALGKPHRTMSENTINDALRTLGYSHDDMTGHGFRSMASTLLNEQGCWSADAIERQLAHGEGNHVRAAYNYAEYLPERRRMMQAWADCLDALRVSKGSASQCVPRSECMATAM